MATTSAGLGLEEISSNLNANGRNKKTPKTVEEAQQIEQSEEILKYGGSGKGRKFLYGVASALVGESNAKKIAKKYGNREEQEKAFQNIYGEEKKTSSRTKSAERIPTSEVKKYLEEIKQSLGDISEIKEALERIEKRISPRDVTIGKGTQAQTYRFDPLAPLEQQVTEVNETGLAGKFAGKKETAAVLSKAAYFGNQDLIARKQQQDLRKGITPAEETKVSGGKKVERKASVKQTTEQLPPTSIKAIINEIKQQFKNTNKIIRDTAKKKQQTTVAQKAQPVKTEKPSFSNLEEYEQYQEKVENAKETMKYGGTSFGKKFAFGFRNTLFGEKYARKKAAENANKQEREEAARLLNPGAFTQQMQSKPQQITAAVAPQVEGRTQQQQQATEQKPQTENQTVQQLQATTNNQVIQSSEISTNKTQSTEITVLQNKLEQVSQSTKDIPTIKDSVERIEKRVSPRDITVGKGAEAQTYRFDPLAPEGKQVTEVTEAGLAGSIASKEGGGRSDYQKVTSKAAYLGNQDLIDKKEQQDKREVESQTSNPTEMAQQVVANEQNPTQTVPVETQEPVQTVQTVPVETQEPVQTVQTVPVETQEPVEIQNIQAAPQIDVPKIEDIVQTPESVSSTKEEAEKQSNTLEVVQPEYSEEEKEKTKVVVNDENKKITKVEQKTENQTQPTVEQPKVEVEAVNVTTVPKMEEVEQSKTTPPPLPTPTPPPLPIPPPLPTSNNQQQREVENKAKTEKLIQQVKQKNNASKPKFASIEEYDKYNEDVEKAKDVMKYGGTSFGKKFAYGFRNTLLGEKYAKKKAAQNANKEEREQAFRLLNPDKIKAAEVQAGNTSQQTATSTSDGIKPNQVSTENQVQPTSTTGALPEVQTKLEQLVQTTKDLPSVKDSVERIEKRVSPRDITVGKGEEAQTYRFDPLAPEGKQVTEVTEAGLAGKFAGKTEQAAVLSKAAYLGNQDLVAKKEQQDLRKSEVSDATSNLVQPTDANVPVQNIQSGSSSPETNQIVSVQRDKAESEQEDRQKVIDKLDQIEKKIDELLKKEEEDGGGGGFDFDIGRRGLGRAGRALGRAGRALGRGARALGRGAASIGRGALSAARAAGPALGRAATTAARFLGPAGAVAGAGYTGYQVGQALDTGIEKLTGKALSDRLASGVGALTGSNEEQEQAVRSGESSFADIQKRKNERLRGTGYEFVAPGKYKGPDGKIVSSKELPANVQALATPGAMPNAQGVVQGQIRRPETKPQETKPVAASTPAVSETKTQDQTKQPETLAEQPTPKPQTQVPAAVATMSAVSAESKDKQQQERIIKLTAENAVLKNQQTSMAPRRTKVPRAAPPPPPAPKKDRKDEAVIIQTRNVEQSVSTYTASIFDHPVVHPGIYKM